MRELAGRTIAVTGASGFIGRYLTRALLLRGANVVAVVRSATKAPELQQWGAEVRQADLTDATALAKALQGCEALFANAGIVSLGQYSKAQLLTTNYRSAANVAEAMVAAGLKRVVLTSSVAVYRPKRPHWYVETDSLRSEGAFTTRFGWYVLSKALGENALRKLCAEGGLELTVVRPGGVYGAWDQSSFTVWFGRMLRPRLLSLMPTHLRIPTVYAADLAEAMVNCLERLESVGKTYNLAGEPSVTYWEMMRGYRAAGGRTPRWVIPIPVPLRYGYDTSLARGDIGFSNRSPQAGFEDMFRLQSEPASRLTPAHSDAAQRCA
jgi:nucleoside-diphosphate-sugar epimerase